MSDEYSKRIAELEAELAGLRDQDKIAELEAEVAKLKSKLLAEEQRIAELDTEEEEGFFLGFVDVQMNSLLIFVGLTAILICMVNPVMENKGIEKKAEFVVIVEWDSESPDDVDSYMQDPAGNICMYQRREDGLMHLDRDDLGHKNDRVETQGGEVIAFAENRETIAVRAIIPGEYVMNIHMYAKRDENPTEVTVRLMKINPKVVVIASRKHTLRAVGEEHTMFRFTVGGDGSVDDVNYLEKKLIGEYGYGDQEYNNEGGEAP
jgi:hypothetical protein